MNTPNNWPAQGQQADDTWVEYIFYPRSSRISSCVTHPNYAAYLLKRRGGNKDRLLMRVYLALGNDPTDYEAINAWLKEHGSRRWTFKEIHATYDHLLPIQ